MTNSTTDYVAVPVEQLAKLEQARRRLFSTDFYAKLNPQQQHELSQITIQMWKVANTKTWS